MRPILSVFFLEFVCVLAFAQDDSSKDLRVVPAVDVQRYCGTWYEIARLPNSFQKQCVGDVTATYTLDNDEFIVVNRCRKENGEIAEAVGRARRASSDGPYTKLKVRFAPAILSFLPFVWGNYWIIDLADDYSYAVVGEPKREYLWILSRTRTLPDATVRQIMERLVQQGYDLKDLKFTVQGDEKSN